MDQKQTWTRRSAAGAKGVRNGAWHLLGPEGVPWCGRELRLTATSSVQGYYRPGGPVCRECLRAERRAGREAAKAARGAAKAVPVPKTRTESLPAT